MKSIDKKIGLILLLVFSIFLVTMGQLFYTFNIMQDDGVAINLAGSQRMRTMLLSDYSLMYLDSVQGTHDFNENAVSEVLKTELDKYNKIMKALVNGDDSLGISANSDANIVSEINNLQTKIDTFTTSVENVINQNNTEKKRSLCKQQCFVLKK